MSFPPVDLSRAQFNKAVTSALLLMTAQTWTTLAYRGAVSEQLGNLFSFFAASFYGTGGVATSFLMEFSLLTYVTKKTDTFHIQDFLLNRAVPLLLSGASGLFSNRLQHELQQRSIQPIQL